MGRTAKDFDRVFGKGSTGETEDARAASSRKTFVRSQLQIAEDNERATGHRLTARQAHWLYGWDVLSKVAEDGSAPLVSMPDEPAATLLARRNMLNLTQKEVARAANVPLEVVVKAETAGVVSPIRDLAKIAQKLGLNEDLLGFIRGAGGDKKLGVRLREMHKPEDVQHFSASDVLKLTEAAWVIARQAELTELITHKKQSSLRELFVVDPDYRFPTYEKGYALAAETRRRLNLSQDDPISSIKSLVEKTLRIPVVQDQLAERFAGATVANGSDRGIVVNERGLNENVWVRRMTIAHELGHLLWDPDPRLNRLRVDRYEGIEENPDASIDHDKPRDPVEIRTNAFAIALLAPREAMQKLSRAVSNDVELLSTVMSEYGISATAARYHIGNAAGRDVTKVRLQDLPNPSDEWNAAENLTVDWFPLNETPISRRGNFAYTVARAFELHLISLDAAALYLETTSDRFLDNLASILGVGA